MLKADLKAEPREFRLKDTLCRDHGTISLVPQDDRTHEFITLETPSGKQCDVSFTPWGFYLGPSLNSRLASEGFRSALMMNAGNQLYVVAVEEDRIEQFQSYLEANESKVICWLDQWFKESKISSPHA